MPNHESNLPDDRAAEEAELQIQRDYRELVTASRDILGNTVRSTLDRIYTFLPISSAVHLLSIYDEGLRSNVTIINNPEISGPDTTIVISNKYRHALPPEPNFPDGHTIELTDLVIPRYKSNLLNCAFDKIYMYNDHGNAVKMSPFATFIKTESDSVHLLGGKWANHEPSIPPPRIA